MLAHHRWWMAVFPLFIATSLAGLWLEGDLRSVVRAILIIATYGCGLVGVVRWFRWSQRDEAVTTPVDAPPEPRPDRRIFWGYLGAFILYGAFVNVAGEIAAEANWYKPVMTLAVITFWGVAAWYFMYIVRLRHPSDSARP